MTTIVALHIPALIQGHRSGEWRPYCPACTEEVGEPVEVCRVTDMPWPASNRLVEVPF